MDAVTVEVTAAFEAAGIDSILLKGPTIAHWLYAGSASRPYADSDLLVAPDRRLAAHAVLEQLRFRRTWGPMPHPGMEAPPAYPWRRGGLVVDLHETIPGAEAESEHVWNVLRAGSTHLDVGGRPTRVLGEPARLLHVALHAVHHGPRVDRPRSDLRRALQRLTQEDWAAAADVAVQIDAAPGLARGLAMEPAGRLVAARLGLSHAPVFEDLPLAGGIARLRATPGARGKGRLLLAELFPSPGFMRWWTPLARRSPRGLAAAYAWRVAYLLREATATMLALFRARRAAGRRPG